MGRGHCTPPYGTRGEPDARRRARPVRWAGTGRPTVARPQGVPSPTQRLRNQLEAEGNDLLREMVRSFAQGLMSAEADVVCGAPWGQQSPDRVNRRNGYRTRRWDTRVGSIELRIPKLRRGSYFPEWLLDARTRSERAFVQVVTEAYVRGISTWKVEGLVETVGVTSLSKSQVSELARGLDQTVSEFRNRPLDAGPYTYAWADALVVKCLEGGRVVNVALLLAVGVNNEGASRNIGPRCRYGRGRGRLACLLAQPCRTRTAGCAAVSAQTTTQGCGTP